MYADDIVLLAECEEDLGLQTLLNTLNGWCSKYNGVLQSLTIQLKQKFPSLVPRPLGTRLARP